MVLRAAGVRVHHVATQRAMHVQVNQPRRKQQPLRIENLAAIFTWAAQRCDAALRDHQFLLAQFARWCEDTAVTDAHPGSAG